MTPWQARARLVALWMLATGAACGDTNGSGGPADGNPLQTKPMPAGVFQSIGPLLDPAVDRITNLTLGPSVDGVLLQVDWNLCGEDQTCLVEALKRQLDAAQARGLRLALAVSDGDRIPQSIKSACQSIAFSFRGQAATMCVAWDPIYLAAKADLVAALGSALDAHPALAYFYFTGACSTNGYEGHCRVDEVTYENAGYTADRLANAYQAIMDDYLVAFPTTPLAFEVHAVFDSADVWQRLWDHAAPSGRVGVAAWWCSERLSLSGAETVPVWPIVQAAADTSFAVCQTVASFTTDPWRFSDASLGLSYGTQDAWGVTNVTASFNDTLDWAEGIENHAGQAETIRRFSVLEAWTADATNADFQERLNAFADDGSGM